MKTLYESILGNNGAGIEASLTRWVLDNTNIQRNMIDGHLEVVKADGGYNVVWVGEHRYFNELTVSTFDIPKQLKSIQFSIKSLYGAAEEPKCLGLIFANCKGDVDLSHLTMAGKTRSNNIILFIDCSINKITGLPQLGSIDTYKGVIFGDDNTINSFTGVTFENNVVLIDGFFDMVGAKINLHNFRNNKIECVHLSMQELLDTAGLHLPTDSCIEVRGSRHYLIPELGAVMDELDKNNKVKNWRIFFNGAGWGGNQTLKVIKTHTGWMLKKFS